MKSFEPQRGQSRRGKRRGHGETISVDGVIYPADWNERGEVTALDLVTNDDQVLRIANSDKFLAYQDAFIAAQGILARNHRAGKHIRIKRFSVLQPMPADV